jgi:steroid delta-isomerase-like uncharacterized protein
MPAHCRKSKGDFAMSTEASKAVVRRMVEQGMIVGDLDAAVAAYAPDFVYHNPVVAEMPGLPPGPEGMRLLLAGARAAFPDMQYSIVALIGEGDTVAVLYTWHGTHRGTIGGVPATGRAVTATGAIVCRVVGDRIVEQWDIDDRLHVLQQLDIALAPSPVAS